MECILLRFPTCVIGSSLAEMVKIENTWISNQNYVDRGSDCEVKLVIQIKSDCPLICFTFVTKLPGNWYPGYLEESFHLSFLAEQSHNVIK